MGKLNGRDRRFKGNRGPSHGTGSRKGFRSINHASSAHAGAMRRNFTVRLFRANAKPDWHQTSSGRFHCQKKFKRSDQVPTVVQVPKV